MLAFLLRRGVLQGKTGVCLPWRTGRAGAAWL